MVEPGYGPSRRRGVAGWLLDWAAGVLIAILLTGLAAGLMTLFVAPGLDRLGALVTLAAVAWPIGAALGVFLSAGRPFQARAFAGALGLTLVGAGALMLPYWLDFSSDVIRSVAGIAALALAPAFARFGLGLARKQE